MSDLKIKVVLNKGRQGVPIKRLVKVADETRKFLEMFAKDVGLGEGEWIAEHFTNTSVGYDGTFIGESNSRTLNVARTALRHITDAKRTPDDLKYGLTRETFYQYGRIAAPIPADDVVSIGIYDDGKPEPEMRALSKARFLEIERQIVERLTQYGGVKGVITALFRGVNTIWVHELSSGHKVVCEFEADRYDEIWALLKSKDTVVNVEGWITRKPGDDPRLKIATISPATEYQEGDLEKFFGIDPQFTGDMTTDEYLDDLRGESTEDYLERLS